MRDGVTRADRVGLVRPAVDAHTLGVSSLAQILLDCGYTCVIADAAACEAFGRPDPAHLAVIEQWLREHRITVLGFSYRLDPVEGAGLFERLVHQLKTRRLLAEQGGPVRLVYFAGLPGACRIVKERVREAAAVFGGDETPAEVLTLLGINPAELPGELVRGMAYDDDRLAFGRELLRKGGHLAVEPVDRSGCPEFGTAADTLMARLAHGAKHGLPPLMRAHVGPYQSDRRAAVAQFLDWTRQLAAAGFLDVLSIGTSQLTQSDFGVDWGNRPNGGGVPLNSREEFAAVWQAARPMLVRTYAGTRNVADLARLYEETIHIAWHALSFWWFCRIDGRGPYDVRENLRQHLETVKYIASTGKPLEANVPHHFAFRGADDATYVVSDVLAARAAKALGLRRFIFQNMLNTPKSTWGVQDLAKSRATLALLRELEDRDFRVILQPRGGLDYFSPDLEKAKVQLAAVTALMDDIEPQDPLSPPVIHVLSYSEASHLADPPVVNESVQITRHALDEYRRLRQRGDIDDMTQNAEVVSRTQELLDEARTVLRAIEETIREPYSAEGLYRIFAAGFLPAPYLWECREEFARAVCWTTRVIRGAVKVVDGQGKPMSAAERLAKVREGLG